MDPGATQDLSTTQGLSTTEGVSGTHAVSAAGGDARDRAASTTNLVTASRQRHAHRALILAAIASAIASVVLAIAGSSHALTAGACLAGFLAADVILGVARRRAGRLVQVGRDSDPTSRARRIGMRVGLRIIVVLFLAAALVAAIELGSHRLILGIAIAVLAFALVGAPTWLAAAEEEERE